MVKNKIRKLIRRVRAKAEESLERLVEGLRPQPTLVPIPVRVRDRRR